MSPASRFSCRQAETEEPIFMLFSAAIKTSTCAPPPLKDWQDCNRAGVV